MIVRLCLLACLALFMTVPAMGQGDPPPDMMPPEGPHGPEVLLGPPEGLEPPEDVPPMPEDPEAAHQMGLEIFFQLMAGDDNLVDLDEFLAWVRHFRMPPPEEMGDPAMHDPGMDDPGMHDPGDGPPPEGMGGLHEGDPDLAGLPHPPECSAELQEQEMGPQEEGYPCGDRDGNLVFRTVCNMPGFRMAAITLPENRGAACFGIEALRGHIDFQIVDAMDGSVVWDTSMGKEAYKSLKLDGAPGSVFHIQVKGGSPEGSVTVRYVDVQTDM